MYTVVAKAIDIDIVNGVIFLNSLAYRPTMPYKLEISTTKDLLSLNYNTELNFIN